MVTRPRFTESEAASQAIFATLMDSLNHPGQVYQLFDTPMVTRLDGLVYIGEAFLHAETSFFTVNETFSELLLQTSAQKAPPNRAAFHFYPEMDQTGMTCVTHASIGTPDQPDHSATVIVGCRFGDGTSIKLIDPSSQGEIEIKVLYLPDAFWNLREQKRRAPLGWDIILVSGQQIIGIPWSVEIVVAE